MILPASDVGTLERATLAAVPPQALEELEGWLLGLDDGTVGRACSAVPLAHVSAPAGLRERIVARYRERALPPMFRIARDPCFNPMRRALEIDGFASTKPTLVQVGTVSAMARLSGEAQVLLTAEPDETWSDVFLGEGFDPVDAQSRLAILQRSRQSVFACASVDGAVAAVGAACFSHGWCGVHGMRTSRAARGRGLAGAILAAFARAAAARGISRSFLQVEQGNAGAQSLYRRAGFSTAWTYDYWRQPAVTA